MSNRDRYLVPFDLEPQTGISGFSNVGWTNLFATPTSENIFLGTLAFHVDTPVESIIQLRFFNANAAVAQDGSLALITPDFTGFTVLPASVPEPGVSALMGIGLVGLILAGRMSKK